MVAGASFYVRNMLIRTDFQTLEVKEEIRPYISHYSVRLSVPCNSLLVVENFRWFKPKITYNCEKACEIIGLQDL
jgi:hypothetical protein